MQPRKFPYHGIVGLVLLFLFWILNWSLPGLRTHWGFFPQWLGYILTVDAWVYFRTGTSLFFRSKKTFFLLFIFSIPLWWIFESINEITQYWVYSSNDQFTDFEYFFWASLSFSTVIPAILETNELVRSYFKKEERTWILYGSKPWQRWLFFVLGWIMLGVVILFPRYGAAFLWISLFFILDPINYWLGFKSILKLTGKGKWRIIWTLWIASLICGFFWEMWNYYSFPKWYYSVPGIDFGYIFEMPFPGYLGYLPFSLEVYAFYQLCSGILNLRE